MKSFGRISPRTGVMPPQQCFEPDHSSGPDILLWLIDEAQLALRDRAPEVLLEGPAVAHSSAHRGFEKAVDPAAFILGAIKRSVGVAHQRLPIRRIVRTNGDTDAGREQ